MHNVYERAREAELVNRVIVATDDGRILDAVKGFGGEVVMTAGSHKSGTDRLAEVAAALESDIIVNVQGDEPLIEPAMINGAIRPMMEDGSIVMGSLKGEIRDEAELNNPNIVKVVVDRNDFALYFSRYPIPYVRDTSTSQEAGVRGRELEVSSHASRLTSHFKHIGLYVYRRGFLLEYAGMPQTPLEEAEKLEQLRALENGYRIKVPTTRLQSIGVDTEEDLERVRRLLKG
ncbi:MAG: 3-deoxy-manno-octulosonate cytidylyltransferase [Deltaproteobacteria bacterium]|nr:3-deoxy-manno-octulosonate cytidylyltransferase [Deltaproteobacteria bacterium]